MDSAEEIINPQLGSYFKLFILCFFFFVCAEAFIISTVKCVFSRNSSSDGTDIQRKPLSAVRPMNIIGSPFSPSFFLGGTPFRFSFRNGGGV